MNKAFQRGDVSIYIALVMLILITTSAIFLTNLLAQQSHLVRDVVESERAFSAANSGLEESMYSLVVLQRSGDIHSTVDYDTGDQAKYTAQSYPTGEANSQACANSDGQFRTSNRHLHLGPDGC